MLHVTSLLFSALYQAREYVGEHSVSVTPKGSDPATYGPILCCSQLGPVLFEYGQSLPAWVVVLGTSNQ